jgi:hypothetical protein
LATIGWHGWVFSAPKAIEYRPVLAAGMDGMKAAGAFMGLPRELRHNMWAIYCENRNEATLQTLFSGLRWEFKLLWKRGR